MKRRDRDRDEERQKYRDRRRQRQRQRQRRSTDLGTINSVMHAGSLRPVRRKEMVFREEFPVDLIASKRKYAGFSLVFRCVTIRGAVRPWFRRSVVPSVTLSFQWADYGRKWSEITRKTV